MMVRECVGPAEAAQVEELQLTTWHAEREIVPKGLLIALQLEGGLLAGAFEGSEMTGFVLGFPTRDPALQHSHMLAVRPEFRRTGAGLALKAFQREWCLARGISRVTWTFDPLRAANARFNVRKLGATVRTYYPNLYGSLAGFNAGVESDRILAEWDLGSERVRRALAGEFDDSGGQDAPTVNPGAPEEFQDDLDAPRLRVLIPDDFGQLLTHDMSAARAWRQHGREVLTAYLSRGYTITGFARENTAYLLTK